MNLTNSRYVQVLLSGGIDSSACVAFYLEHGFSVSGAFIDYGQAANLNEAHAAKIISEYYKIPLKQFMCSGFHKKKEGYIRGRNAFFLIAALMELSEKKSIIAMGIHSGTEYIDCSSMFINDMQSIFDSYTNGVIQIGVPFLKWTKNDIWSFCKSRSVPIDLTYSCELGLEQPCGKCLSCHDLEVLYASSQKKA